MLIKLFCILACILTHGFTYAVQQDPTRPPSVIAEQLAPLKQVQTHFQLSAIFTRKELRYAVVNGEVLKQGDEIMGMKVQTIDSSQVRLSDPGFHKDDIVLEMQSSAGMNKQVVK